MVQCYETPKRGHNGSCADLRLDSKSSRRHGLLVIVMFLKGMVVGWVTKLRERVHIFPASTSGETRKVLVGVCCW